MRWCVLVVMACVLVTPQEVEAQGCSEFCEDPLPCYRDPDDPECNADCHCGAADYPGCDPLCPPGVSCDPACSTDPCVDEFGYYVCTRDDPPPACPEGDAVSSIRFIDDQDGENNDEIAVLFGRGPREACARILVTQTGYYELFDLALSESCDSQRDETAYLTVSNTCNGGGDPLENNAAGHYVVDDQDNTPTCTPGAGACGAGDVCRDSHAGFCCAPASPVFLGTFLLVAGEDNRVCLHHWCDEHAAETAAGRDWGHVNEACSGINSIHMRLDGNTLVCAAPDTTLQACAWGCGGGLCNPDPCDAAGCPAFCKDGVCLDDNPCDDVTCEHGCHRGRCLQPPWAPGVDADGDGFSSLSECDDSDPNVNPRASERCNGVDEDCDGRIDEECSEPGSDAGTRTDGGSSGEDAGPGPGEPNGLGSDGCGCRMAGSTNRLATSSAIFALFALVFVRRRRRD